MYTCSKCGQQYVDGSVYYYRHIYRCKNLKQYEDTDKKKIPILPERKWKINAPVPETWQTLCCEFENDVGLAFRQNTHYKTILELIECLRRIRAALIDKNPKYKIFVDWIVNSYRDIPYDMRGAMFTLDYGAYCDTISKVDPFVRIQLDYEVTRTGYFLCIGSNFFA